MNLSNCFIYRIMHTIKINRILAVFIIIFVMIAAIAFVLNKVKAGPQTPSSFVQSEKNQIEAASKHIPLTFIENIGQFDDRIHFQATSGNTTFFMTDDAIWINTTETSPQSNSITKSGYDEIEAGKEANYQISLKLSFVNANSQFRLEPFARLDTDISFLTGNDPTNWQTNVPVWGGVRYKNLYPGIDLEITSINQQLTQRLIVKEPSALKDVRLNIEGADTVSIEGNHMHLSTLIGDVVLPLLNTEEAEQISAPAILKFGNSFQIASPFASTTHSAINIKPQKASPLFNSTYLGGNGNDIGYDIALDNSGNIYITGQTSSTDFPTTPGVHDQIYNGNPQDAFVSKLSADGSRLLYSTFLGGISEDVGNSIAIDWEGNAYIAGYTFSTDFPTTTGVLDRSLNGGRDAFVAKLNNSGDNLIYSTYLGGDSWDYGFCIEVDDIGNAYVGGFTHGVFPTTAGAAQTAFGGSGDGFAVKIDQDASTLLYSTYLGGSSWEAIEGIAVDTSGNAYLASHTHSPNFPTTPGAWDRTCDNCQTNVSTDGAVAKLNADGSEFIYSTFIGGADASGVEAFKDIAINRRGDVFLTGYTSSIDFPTTKNALQPEYGGGNYDAIVVKLNMDGSNLLYSTYLGGMGTDAGYAIAIDRRNNAYITGSTTSTDFPTHRPFQAANAGNCDAFVTTLNKHGRKLRFSTYMGGSGDENCQNSPHDHGGIAVAGRGNIYFAGFTNSTDFPTTINAIQTTFGGSIHDAFVTWLNPRCSKIKYHIWGWQSFIRNECSCQ